jgi:glycosyltransferase involved in cell wall biosynthesis
MRKQLLDLGADPEKTNAHYIGVPLEKFTFQQRETLSNKIKNNESITFLQVSNFVEKKGHRYTIEAFSNIIQDYPNCKLVLAGDGLLRPKIEKLVKVKKIQDKVIFLGRVTTNEVIPLMHDADIFLHHSVTASDGSQEGIPTVLMEAMGTGLPVFSTYHTGIPELIEDEKTGYLSPEKDVRHYTQKILKFLTGRYHPGRNASNAVHKRFNIAIQNQRLKQIYKEIANE